MATADLLPGFEDRSCPLGCPLSDQLEIEAGDRLHGLPGRYRVVRCARCGLLRTNPRPAPAAMGSYYPEDYGPHQMNDEADASPAGAATRRARLLRRLGLEVRATPPVSPGRLLEIGCASGGWLARMQQAGWSVRGIEFSPRAAERARHRGFDVQVATIESATAPPEPVELVAAWMVLEHLHEPVEALRRVREWVTPEGYLIASVPDAGALERRLFGARWYALQLPTHLFHYSPATLGRLLAAAGWRVERVAWQPNCMNLLHSLEYLAEDRGQKRLGSAVRWLRSAPGAARLRVILGWLLARLRQSGRIEVWARPAAHRGGAG
ncbi:MAG: class I SAM-dependent methyltransferase [Lysobacterales bacterium]|nr:MAG: class I SAM-dependent methyltransferase [Xanthomonadales bacterium]